LPCASQRERLQLARGELGERILSHPGAHQRTCMARSLLEIGRAARTGVRQDPLAELTPPSCKTLSLLAQGKPYGRIAEELNVSYKTVVNACSQLKQKLTPRACRT